MGKRSTARRLTMQVLFQFDMGQSDIDYVLTAASERENFLEETLQMAKTLITGVKENLTTIDNIIREKSIGWSLDRITGVDRAILRSAIYEINYIKTPPSIVINEAVNLAKKFSTAESSKFVNGILGSLVG